MSLNNTYEEIVKKYHNLAEILSDPSVINDREKYLSLTKEHSFLSERVNAYEEFQKLENEIKENEALLKEEENEEMKEMITTELKEGLEKKIKMEEHLYLLLVPEDTRDERNVILEIRAGTGGDESAIFSADLFRMYLRYAEEKGWKVEITDSNETGIGGYKEIVAMIRGKNVYSCLKFESGIHRVQRIPVTESGGRVHTSAATVAVLPEADETEVEISSDDIRLDVFRASGAGGQHVNKTESAVRITHIPSGLVVSCQDEKSQHKNRERAMKVLRARLYEQMEKERLQEISKERKQQVGSGDRSGKIRTYNFPQNRLTDHRIGLTLYKLDRIMEGDLDELVDALSEHDNKEKLASVNV